MQSNTLRDTLCPVNRTPLNGMRKAHHNQAIPQFRVIENFGLSIKPLMKKSSPTIQKDFNQKLQLIPQTDANVKERPSDCTPTSEHQTQDKTPQKTHDLALTQPMEGTIPKRKRKPILNEPIQESTTTDNDDMTKTSTSSSSQKDLNQKPQLVPQLATVRDRQKCYPTLENPTKERMLQRLPHEIPLTYPMNEAPLKGLRRPHPIQQPLLDLQVTDNIEVTIKSLMSSPSSQKDYKHKAQHVTHASASIKEKPKDYPTSLENQPKKDKTIQKLPKPPDFVLENYWSCLTKYERREIRDYQEIWYLGKKTNKAVVSENQQPGIYNFGFDNECGTYKSIINDHLAYRFQILKVLGKGFSGEVLKCMDHKTKEIVAIKVFKNLESILWLAKAEMRNLKLLKNRTTLECVVHLKDHFSFRKHLCIIFDLYDGDLHQLIRHRNKHRIKENDLKFYTVDVLKCLELLKRMKIVHGDLKPENILLRSKGNEKHAAVTDFGGSYFTCDRTRPPVFTLNYMSPEMLLGKKCRTPIDMWSLGCILAEAHLRERLFKGSEDISVFNSIVEILGIPPKEMLHNSKRKHRYFDSSGNPKYVKKITTLEKKLKAGNPLFVDFIQGCLEYDPRKRLTPQRALHHPWLQKEIKGASTSQSSKSSNLSIFRLPNVLNRDRTPASKIQPDAALKDCTKNTATTSTRPTAPKTPR